MNPTNAPYTRIPEVSLPDASVRKCYEAAVHNLTVLNTIPCNYEVYNSTGLLSKDCPYLIQAGVDYGTPWIRDASVNVWNAARFLEPEAARNTLLAVCVPDENGEPVIQEPDDNGFVQNWDKIIWAIGAWNYYLASGDLSFLQTAFGAVRKGLDDLKKQAFQPSFGLFMGGSFFNDGIAGYPSDLHDPAVDSSFAPDHEKTRTIMCLSTNCIFCEAYRILSEISRKLGDERCAQEALAFHEALKENINRYFWNDSLGRYDYIVYPSGKKDTSQEEGGNAFAVLFSICPEERQDRLLHSLHIDRHGLVSIYPPFPGLFTEEKPGRHNNLIWPFLNAFYLCAAAGRKQLGLVASELTRLTALVQNSGCIFYEIYNPYTGLPDGGWQVNRHWHSMIHQTWSATGYISVIIHGVFGISVQDDGVCVSPCVPDYLQNAEIRNLTVRNLNLSVKITGFGCTPEEIRINQRPVSSAFLPFPSSGSSQDATVEIVLRP